jgi:hypothetical protein
MNEWPLVAVLVSGPALDLRKDSQVVVEDYEASSLPRLAAPFQCLKKVKMHRDAPHA